LQQSPGNDHLWAWGSKNKLNGGLGEDYLHAFGSYNTLSGGDGNDTLVVESSNQPSTGNVVSGDAGNDHIWLYGAFSSTVNGGIGDDDIHGYVFGSSLNGNDGIDFIEFEGFSNTVSGGSGGDELVLYGGTGNVLNGDGGDDYIHQNYEYGEDYGNTFNGGSGNDTIEVYNALLDSINGGDGNDAIYFYTDYGYAVDGFNVVSGGSGRDFIELGQGSSNTIHGNSDNDTIYLPYDIGSNNDAYGDSGNDVIMAGGTGNFLYGGGGQDILGSYSHAFYAPPPPPAAPLPTVDGGAGIPMLGNVLNGEGDTDAYILRSTSEALVTDTDASGQLNTGDTITGLLDVINGYSRYETIDVAGTAKDTSVSFDSITGALLLDSGHYGFVRGDYTAEGTFTVNTTKGVDLLLVYHASPDNGGYETEGAVVLVGVTNASNVSIGTVTPPPDENPQFLHLPGH
jgi:hypothetical protein